LDWNPLLQPPPARESAASVDRRIAEARGRFRRHIDGVGRIGPDAPPPGWTARIAAAWARWWAPPMGDLERLERHVEDAQRQVSRVAAEIDALAGEEDAIAAELAALRDQVAAWVADQAAVEDRARDLRRALVAVDLARSRAAPADGAALEADRAVLAAHLLRCEADTRGLELATVRLAAVTSFGTEALELCGRLRTSLEEVHRRGTALLHALDASLGRLAAEARAGDLERSITAGIEPLRGSVGRVHLEARAGAELLIHRLDTLVEASDLLAPADPARAAAEAEVARIVSRRD
jgi:hypothetical protein